MVLRSQHILAGVITWDFILIKSDLAILVLPISRHERYLAVWSASLKLNVG